MKVEDVAGLLYGLVENKFEVENVAMDKVGVHVYLHDAEEKDPRALVEEWSQKKMPTPTRSLVERRKELHGEMEARRAQRAAEEKAKAENVPPPALLEAPRAETIFAKIFRKLW